jgi:hypothetical protein
MWSRVRYVKSALKRLDTIVAAAMVGVSVAPASSAWLCAESSCRSPFDTALFYAVALLTVTAAAWMLWVRTRRWWTRALTLVAARYASAVVPAWIWRHGRWTVPLERRSSCVVRIGAQRDEVHRVCGAASYWCRGPKHVESTSLWNPLSLEVCGFAGEVYGGRLVAYDCRGRVADVTGFYAGPPERSRPPHCLEWGRGLRSPARHPRRRAHRIASRSRFSAS